MKRATVALLITAVSLGAQAAGGRFSGRGAGGGGTAGPHGAPGVPMHGAPGVPPRGFHGPHTGVIVRGGVYLGWPGPYYWPHPYYYGPGYYYAPAYYYAPPVMAAPEPAYWYYCAPLATYYPYVQDCPGGWQAVTPGYY
jgi:hypothetical protein